MLPVDGEKYSGDPGPIVEHRALYAQEVVGRKAARAAGRVIGSPYHSALFAACGKIPAVPSVASLRPLLAARDFCGDADAYVDATNGSSLLMYCIGPANEETLPMVELLRAHGATCAFQNKREESALAYAKAWQIHDPNCQADAARFGPLYERIIQLLLRDGCDAAERAAF